MVQGIPALLATLGALAATGLLILRAKEQRLPYLIAWCLTMVGISVALIGMTLGFLAGFGGLLFRLMEVGGALLAPAWLALGMAVLITPVMQLRFASWLFGISYSVVAVVILLLDPLKGSFDKSLPDPGRHYDSLPLLLIDLAHGVAVLALVACLVMIALRAGKQDREAYELLMPVALVALAGVLVVSGTRGFLPGVAAVLALAGAAGLVWFGATRMLPQPAAASDEDAYEDEEYQDGEYADEYGRAAHGDEAPAEQGYEIRTGYDEQPYEEQPYAAPADPAATQVQPPSPAHGRPPVPPPGQQPPMTKPPMPPMPPVPPAQPMPAAMPGGPRFRTGERPLPGERPRPAEPPALPQSPPMCGRITVYTLLDGRGEAFDRLAAEAVRAAREIEPDTLIFSCHEVTGAPSQRIVYQLFRDQAAFAEHKRLPQVQRFAAESRPFVAATNVIELNLTAAKVVPLPSLSVQDRP